MQRGGREPFLAADYVRDFHEMVVDDVGQVVGGQVVGALVKHLVVENGGVDGHLAAHQVVDHDVLAGLYLDADHVLVAATDALADFLFAEGQGVGHAHARGGVVLEVGGYGAGGVELLGGVEGYVGAAVVYELRGVFAVDVAAFALAVGRVRAAVGHALVEADAEPVHGLDDVLFGAGHEAAAVGVFDAQDHLAAEVAGEEVVVESGADAADVERARG